MNFFNQSARTALFIGMAAAVTLGGSIASAQAQEKIKIGTLLSASGPAAVLQPYAKDAHPSSLEHDGGIIRYDGVPGHG